MQTSIEPLRQFPLSGSAREQLAAGLRITFHGTYAIYYKTSPDAVVIVRVSGTRRFRVSEVKSIHHS